MQPPIRPGPSVIIQAPSLTTLIFFGCNLRIPLWQLVCASTAAPTYFPPEVVRIGEEEFLFVDGGVTMFNNPAFQLFLMATVEPYNLKWPSGAERMLLVSIGTGTAPRA